MTTWSWSNTGMPCCRNSSATITNYIMSVLLTSLPNPLLMSHVPKKKASRPLNTRTTKNWGYNCWKASLKSNPLDTTWVPNPLRQTLKWRNIKEPQLLIWWMPQRSGYALYVKPPRLTGGGLGNTFFTIPALSLNHIVPKGNQTFVTNINFAGCAVSS